LALKRGDLLIGGLPFFYLCVETTITRRTMDKTREEAMKEAVKNTPQQFSVEDLCGLADDDEDRVINARREYRD
jgi:hypothetical protein